MSSRARRPHRLVFCLSGALLGGRTGLGAAGADAPPRAADPWCRAGVSVYSGVHASAIASFSQDRVPAANLR